MKHIKSSIYVVKQFETFKEEYMKTINLISPKGDIISLKVSFPFIANRSKVKKLLLKGYGLVSEDDADLVIKLGLIN